MRDDLISKGHQDHPVIVRVCTKVNPSPLRGRSKRRRGDEGEGEGGGYQREAVKELLEWRCGDGVVHPVHGILLYNRRDAMRRKGGGEVGEEEG